MLLHSLLGENQGLQKVNYCIAKKKYVIINLVLKISLKKRDCIMIKKIMILVLLCLSTFRVSSREEGVLHMTDPEHIHDLYQIMKDVHEVFTLYDIPYWIDSGTLLGAVRQQGIIPWDKDLDILIDEAGEVKLHKIKKVFEELGYTIQRSFAYYRIAGKYGWIDVLTMIVLDDIITFKEPKARYAWADRDGKPLHYISDELYPLKEYVLGEIIVMGPQNPIPYINALYGDDWHVTARDDSEKNLYVDGEVTLTKELMKPALPMGPLKDRVAKITLST